MKDFNLFESMADITRPEPPEKLSEYEREAIFDAAYKFATRYRGLIHNKRKS